MAIRQPTVQQSFFAFDKINIEISKAICQWIIENNMVKVKHPSLTMFINSDGGELASAFSIIDVMNSSLIPIHTIGTGEIVSAGLMVFMAGNKGTRTLTPNTTVMSHRFSAGIENGKFHDLQAQHKEYEMLNERMMTHFINHTGLTKREIDKVLLPPHDVYLSPEKAVEYNIADIIGHIQFS